MGNPGGQLHFTETWLMRAVNHTNGVEPASHRANITVRCSDINIKAGRSENTCKFSACCPWTLVYLCRAINLFCIWQGKKVQNNPALSWEMLRRRKTLQVSHRAAVGTCLYQHIMSVPSHTFQTKQFPSDDSKLKQTQVGYVIRAPLQYLELYHLEDIIERGHPRSHAQICCWGSVVQGCSCHPKVAYLGQTIIQCCIRR